MAEFAHTRFPQIPTVSAEHRAGAKIWLSFRKTDFSGTDPVRIHMICGFSHKIRVSPATATAFTFFQRSDKIET